MDNIKVGDYIVIQRQNYRKIHKFNKANSAIPLGRDNVELLGIEGCKYYSVFKMIATGNKRSRSYRLELCDEAVGLKDEIDVKTSGLDNRNILDDGKSQKLTAADIEELKTDATSASDIVESLICNSNTFSSKTEYAQDKYLRKKEKKYFDYLQIIQPNLRMVADIMYRLDPAKIQGVRIDTLSQILTMANVYSEGKYLLYDSGSNGLLAAALLSAIGGKTNGKLVHMHPGNMSQKQALLAMNFPEEQLQRCVSVNIYSALRQFYQGCDTHEKITLPQNESNLKRKADEVNDSDHQIKIPKVDETLDTEEIPLKEQESKAEISSPDTSNMENVKDSSISEGKKPKWHFDNIAAAELLTQKMDALVIVCKEDPQNIFKELVQFVKPGRPFLVYYSVAEPLQHLYLSLKSDSKIAALKLTCNWLRNYQILPDRTHPEVNMNAASGFLLSGYVLK